MKVNQLFEDIDIIETKGNIDMSLDIADISYNSKKSTKNSIFVAIKGYLTDGHKYIANAVENGAVIAVVEEFTTINIPQIKVKNTRNALADLSAKFYNHPSEDLFTVGITATNGKTTTAFMANEIFKEYGLETGLSGTVEVKYKDISIPSLLTTPESRDLQSYLRDMVDKNVTDFIMEVSSHAQEMSRVRNMTFDVVTFNNLSREHIDQHGTFENYVEIKSRLIRNAGKDTYVILNNDEPYIKSLKNETQGKVLTYSLDDNQCDFSAHNIDLSSGFGKYIFSINRDIEEIGLKKSEFEIDLGLAGYAGVMNSLVAIIISLVRGIDPFTIKKALRHFKGVERRFQMIYDREFSVVDDHFANVRNISVTMDTISKMDYKNLHVLYAIRGNRGVNLNRESADEMAQWFKKLDLKKVYSTSSQGIVSDKDKVSKDEKQVFLDTMEKNQIQVEHFEKAEDSIAELLPKVGEGDLVLLAGCQGMDYGGEILLNELVKNKSEEEKREILKVLDGREFVSS